MKPFFTLFLCFLPFTLTAQLHSTLAPFNPQPLAYTTAHFNLNGSVKEMESKDENKRYVFDEQGRLVNLLTKNGLEVYTYDKQGNLKNISGQNRQTWTFKSNNQGRLISFINEDKQGSIYEYDQQGNLLQQLNLRTKSIEHRYAYDAQGRIIRQEDYTPGGKLKKIRDFQYDILGPILKVSKYKRGEHNTLLIDETHYYNLLGHVIQTDYYDAGKLWTRWQFNLTYDDQGNVTKNKNSSGIIDREFVYIYFAKDRPAETKPLVNICTYGNCWNGFGSIITANNKYSGFFLNGQLHGSGMMETEDKKIYKGQWQNNRFTGFGTVTGPNELYEFGEFEHGNLNGYGYRELTEIFYTGIWEKDTLTQSYTYEFHDNETGCTEGDCNNGYGKWVFEDKKNELWGFFKNGNLLMGTLIQADGLSINGKVDTQTKQWSYTLITYTDGSWYLGEVNNKINPNGTGILYYANRRAFNGGIFENNTLKDDLSVLLAN